MIILVTHSAYIDICNNFVALFKNNWPDCPYRIIGSVIGENKTIDNIETIYVENGNKLTDCIIAIKDLYKADFYMCFLGDAFISSKVDTKLVISLLSRLKQNKAQYCKIFSRNFKKEVPNTDLIRRLRRSDIYSHSFVAFIASQEFIDNALKGKTDLEFEKEYLELDSNAVSDEEYIDDYLILKDIFHIIPTVSKGKWDRFALSVVKKENPNIDYANRQYLNTFDQVREVLYRKLRYFIPRTVRGKVKKLLSCTGLRFSTKY